MAFTPNHNIRGATSRNNELIAVNDLVKKRMQVKGEYGIPNYSNFIECIKDIAKREGLKGFYHGVRLDYLKMLPANSIFFL